MTVDSVLNQCGTRTTTIVGPAQVVVNAGKFEAHVIDSDSFDKEAWLEEVLSFTRSEESGAIDPLYITLYIPEGVTIQIIENGNPDVGPADGEIIAGPGSTGFIFNLPIVPPVREISIGVLAAPPGSSLTLAVALIEDGVIIGSAIEEIPIS
ncbi:hypothetical protein DFR58_109108 [Anaerobacterium chartisolvens]|uniref:Uncharacterized protein n=1 Tax=Anaerobacterium chartisolvens TaxID=1297424 RepID=A0A369B619_9FIRM|nr:hypothetical protein [Anaerobacterium chartisolvens]RCX16881.1 hypothetical protein DFR58_109108 [Anaerobacterium chartisolvens]